MHHDIDASINVADVDPVKLGARFFFDRRKRVRTSTIAKVLSVGMMLIPHLIELLSFAFQSWKGHTMEFGCNRLKGVVGDL